MGLTREWLLLSAVWAFASLKAGERKIVPHALFILKIAELEGQGGEKKLCTNENI
jgi:hypothetical protein